MSGSRGREGSRAARPKCGVTGCRKWPRRVNEERPEADPLRYLCSEHWTTMKDNDLPDADHYTPIPNKDPAT
jgi:hypothetical protein